MRDETRLQAVDSPELSAVGYNEKRRTAVLVFKATSDVWEFQRVPPEIGAALLQARRPEQYVWVALLNGLTVKRLTPCKPVPPKPEALRQPEPPEPVKIDTPPPPAPVRVEPPKVWRRAARKLEHEPVKVERVDELSISERRELGELKALALRCGGLPNSVRVSERLGWLRGPVRARLSYWLSRVGVVTHSWERRELSECGQYGYRHIGA